MTAYLGEDIPKLGFGLMRLPRIAKDGETDFLNRKVDIDEVKRMVDLFLASGFTYFDTAYGYMDSETAICEALVKRYPRDSYQLATKLPAWTVKSKEEAEQLFWISLERTEAGYFDFYLMHNMGGPRIPFFDDYGIWDFLAKRKEEGLIRHIGFSLHDSASVLEKLLIRYPETEFVQLQINYADWDDPTVESRKCYETARRYGKPVIVMEPVKGGNLMTLPPAAVDAFKALDPDASLASWAIRFGASLEGTITVLSGMSNMAQMEDNVSFMKGFKPLDERELTVIARVRDEIAKLPAIPCTNCGYCQPVCEQNVAIPGIFESMNLRSVFNSQEGAGFNYMWNTKGNWRSPASACIECGNCEAVCPQSIEIIKELKKARELFEPQI